MDILRDLYTMVAEKGIQKKQVECENQEMRDQLHIKTWEMNELEKIKKALRYEMEDSFDISGKLKQKKCQLETMLTCKEEKVRLMENSSNIEELCHCKQNIDNALRRSKARNGDLQTNWEQTIACLQNRNQGMESLEKKMKNLTCLLCELNQHGTSLLHENKNLKQHKQEYRICLAEALQKQCQVKQCLQKEQEAELCLRGKLGLKNYLAQTQDTIAHEKCRNKRKGDELKCLREKYEILLRENCDLNQTQRLAREECRDAEICLRSYESDVARVRNDHARMKKSIKSLKNEICCESTKPRDYKSSPHVRTARHSLKCRGRGI